MARSHDADALSSYGAFLASTRRFDEAVRLSMQALALDPLNPAQLVRAMTCTNLARRFDETLALRDRAIERMPEFPESYRWRDCRSWPSGAWRRASPPSPSRCA